MSDQLGDTGFVPATDENFDEQRYLQANVDVAQAVQDGFLPSGRWHFDVHGHKEGRLLAPPADAERTRGWRRLATLWRRDGGTDVTAELSQLATRVYDVEVANVQLQHMLQLAHRLGPPPPKHLQVRVVGSYNGDFIRSGFRTVCPELDAALAHVGRSLIDFSRILDFGCGCGRALFALASQAPQAELFGTDIDPEAIDWLTVNHPDLASYTVSPHLPPLGYADDSFDFVFGISVFTHLPEDIQFQWLEELGRITEPGGFVVVTTHGEHHYLKLLSEGDLEAMTSKGFVYIDSGYGESVALPGFYQTAFHSGTYIREHWSRYFDVIDILPPGASGHQDTVVLRKPGAT